MINEANKGHYKRTVGDVFIEDSVLLARLIVNYFRKKGLRPIYNSGTWGDDSLSARRGNEGSFQQRNWKRDWSQDGVNIRFKHPTEDRESGFMRIGLKNGSAIVGMRANNITKTYNIGLNKSVLEFAQVLTKKYKSLLAAEPSVEDEYQKGSQELIFVNMYKKKGMNANYDEEHGAMYVWPNDFAQTFSKEERNILNNIFRDPGAYLVVDTIVKNFVLTSKYIIKKYAAIGKALNTKDFSAYNNKSEGIKMAFNDSTKENVEQAMKEAFDDLNELLVSKNNITKEEYRHQMFKKALQIFFEDERKMNQVVSIFN